MASPSSPITPLAVTTYELGDGSPFTTSAIAIQLVIGTTTTMAFECSMDGTNWVAINAMPSNSTTAVTSTTTAGIWRIDTSGLRIRLNVTVSTGTNTVTWKPLVG